MKTIAAIELGSDKITCAVASIDAENDKPRIIGFAGAASRGIKRGHIIDISQTIKALEECLNAAERMAGTRINRAVIIANGPSVSSQISHGIVAVNQQSGEITEADIGRAIESAKAISLAASRQIIHVLPREFIVDGQGGIKNPVGMSGVRLEVNTHIITASSINLTNMQKVCHTLGVDVEGFVFAALASSYATLSETEKELGCVLVDIGGGTSSMAIFVDQALVHTAVVPIGAKSVTSDIAAGLRISLESAEKIKLHLTQQHSTHALRQKVSKRTDDADETDEISIHSLDIPEKLETVSRSLLVDGIIRPRLEEIAQFIRDEISKSGVASQIPSGIVLTGGGSLTPYIEDTLKRTLGVSVTRHAPLELAGISEELLDPRYASLVGALLYAQGEKTETQNFAMPEFGAILKNFDIKSSTQKAMDFLKSFIPGAK